MPKKKPDPAIYNLAAKELGVNPANCCVVEDSHIGLKVRVLFVCGCLCVSIELLSAAS